ncbi:MAG TPA: 50S ribosomal protein L25 [Acidimicrobiales bacterium]|jgi:large subunit ribosomal protein L25|nr:50S ribosomal protein L25 [Acidimicrobiales bacterium]
MAEIILQTETGRGLGSGPARRLRAEGKVPGVVYGQGADPIAVAVEWRPFRAALSGEAGLNALLDLQIDGETKLAIVKDLQRHPVTGNVLHVDFLLISRDVAISVDVPLVLEGEPTLVLREGGLIETLATSLTITAKPADIPNELQIDVTELELGASIRVGDIKLPPGVTTDVDPEEPVIITTLPAVVEEPAAEGEEGQAGEEGEAAEAAGGEEAAGGGGEEPAADGEG